MQIGGIMAAEAMTPGWNTWLTLAYLEQRLQCLTLVSQSMERGNYIAPSLGELGEEMKIPCE